MKNIRPIILNLHSRCSQALAYQSRTGRGFYSPATGCLSIPMVTAGAQWIIIVIIDDRSRGRMFTCSRGQSVELGRRRTWRGLLVIEGTPHEGLRWRSIADKRAIPLPRRLLGGGRLLGGLGCAMHSLFVDVLRGRCRTYSAIRARPSGFTKFLGERLPIFLSAATRATPQ
jgi:hypothetical protein